MLGGFVVGDLTRTSDRNMSEDLEGVDMVPIQIVEASAS